METTKDTYQYLEFKNNIPTTLLTLEQVVARANSLTTPVPVVPVTPPPAVVDYVALQKRVLVGTKNGRNIYTALLGGFTRLIDQVGKTPDAFFVRGFNFDYTPTLGAKPAGESTPWSGLAEPASMTTPKGYYVRYSAEATSAADRYYELGDKPDEVFTPKVTPKPTTPTTEVPKGNQSVTPAYTLGNLMVGTQAQ